MKKQISFVAFILMIAQAAFAAPMNEFPASEWTTRDGYVAKTVGKLGFGVVNLAGGWTALGTEPFEEPESNPVVTGLRTLARVVTNTVGGALHVVTFPAPFDIPLPGGGATFE